ncbi:MAG: FprA family A-type flavoprotein [Verrucomicrobia bacterium]|nr:FprA family A-type flavoprotein [Verrucomicrobiota bacterium]
MNAQKIADDIYRIAVNIEDRDYRFEGIWPLPNGISINAYLIRDEKNVLIDLTQDIMDFPRDFSAQLGDASLSVEDIDIVVVNHMEPDHTGWLREFCARNSKAVIYCSEKAVPLLAAFMGIGAGRIVVVTDGMTLSLGRHELQFFSTPNIHWPETIMTWERTRGILFSGDAFGSYGSVPADVMSDGRITAERRRFYLDEARRYYANIVATFSASVLKGIEKIARLDIRIICPSHGIVWQERPGEIVEEYRRLAGYGSGPGEREVTLVWGSMYGNTEKAVGTITDALRARGIPVRVFHVPADDVSYILASAWRSNGLIFCMPTYDYQMFPPMAHVIDELLRKRMRNKKVFRCGSYGWVGGAQKDFLAMTEKSGWEICGSYEWKGAMTGQDHGTLRRLVGEFADRVIA